MKKILISATLLCAAVLSPMGSAVAQVAGSTIVGVATVDMLQVAQGWSVKRSILGKNIYNDEGQTVGKVEDLIVSPEQSLTYVIVGAGGFIGIGQHDVAIPISQIKDQDGRFVIPGATKTILKALPLFVYADDTSARNKFIANADRELLKARADVAAFQKKAKTAEASAKESMDMQANSMLLELRTAEEKLAILKSGGVARWQEFRADVNAALARLRKLLDSAA